MLNHAVQSSESVARHGSVHMMFGVVVHVPVEEADEWMKDDGPATQAVIRDIVLEADVLGVVA